jgi:hypothetical protein
MSLIEKDFFGANIRCKLFCLSMQNYAFENVIGFGGDGRVFHLDSEINARSDSIVICLEGFVTFVVFLVNRAWHPLPTCLYFKALRPSLSSQIGSKIAYTWRM